MKIDPHLSSYTKLQTDPKPQRRTKKSVSDKEKVGNNIEIIDTGKKFLNRTLIALASKQVIDNWDLLKFYSFCTAKCITIPAKWQPTE